MIYTPSRIPGAWIIDVEPIHDERGFFAMTWLPEELRERGMDPALAQCNLAFNHKRGTLRGMHLQTAPHAQAKIVRATRGALLDVIVDLRPDSPTFKKWDAVELTADNRRMLYIPAGIAHGYITLTDDTEAYYHASTPWAPSAERGVRWNDPAFAIEWPFPPTVISAKDEAWPLLTLDRLREDLAHRGCPGDRARSRGAVHHTPAWQRRRAARGTRPSISRSGAASRPVIARRSRTWACAPLPVALAWPPASLSRSRRLRAMPPSIAIESAARVRVPFSGSRIPCLVGVSDRSSGCARHLGGFFSGNADCPVAERLAHAVAGDDGHGLRERVYSVRACDDWLLPGSYSGRG